MNKPNESASILFDPTYTSSVALVNGPDHPRRVLRRCGDDCAERGMILASGVGWNTEEGQAAEATSTSLALGEASTKSAEPCP